MARRSLVPARALRALLIFLTIAPAVTKAQEECQAAGYATQRLTVGDKWWNFVCETANPLTLVAGAFNGAVAHVTDTDPDYGTDGDAFGERVGASTLDIATQNFFGDFVLASALHEDPRYFRRGPRYRMWPRVGYAISRAWLIRKDEGGTTFNWSNVLGAGMSTGLSYRYYPPASRGAEVMTFEFVSSALGSGFANIALEFWPDVRQKIWRTH